MFGMLKQDLEEFKRMYRQQNGVWPELADLDDHYLRLVEDKVRSTDLGDLASAQVREAERGAEDEAIERICQLLSAVLRVNPGERLRQYGLLRSRLGQEWLQLYVLSARFQTSVRFRKHFLGETEALLISMAM